MRKDSFRRYKGGVLVAFWNLSIDFEMMLCYMADWLEFVAVAEAIDMFVLSTIIIIVGTVQVIGS